MKQVKKGGTSVVGALFAGILAAAVLIGGATTAFADSSTPTMDRIKKAGKLRVGVSGSQPPYNMKNKSGQIIGLEADLATVLAQSMGVEVQFVVKPFSELLGAVEKGEVDMAMSGLTMTPERNTRVAFAGPYFISGKGVLTTSAALAKADDPTDIIGNYTLAALDNSTSLTFIQNVAPEVKAVGVKDYDQGIKMVIDGKADALVADFAICLVSLYQYPDKGLQAATAPFTFEPLGAALPANDPLFLNLVENFMSMLEGTGLMEGLRAKWFDDGSWLAELP